VSKRAVQHWLGVLATLACLAAILVACQSQAAPAPTPESTTSAPAAGQQARLRVAVAPTFPPFAAPGGSEYVIGFDVDLIKAIAGRAGMGVELIPVARHTLLNGIVTCEFDVGLSALAMTDALRQQITFSEPYATVGQVVVVKKGNIKIADREDLAGMTVGVERGSRGEQELQGLPGAQPKLYASANLAFQDLIAGYIDATITNRPLAQTYVSIPANNLKITGDDFGAEDYGIAVCNQQGDVLQQVNQGLAAIKTDGTLDKLTQKWLGTR
jgi:polar amino acid transport system substrate-binding protein